MAKTLVTNPTVNLVLKALPQLVKLPSQHLWVDYDRDADVLYLSLERPQQATDTRAMLNGQILLRSRGKRLVGITILRAKSLLH